MTFFEIVVSYDHNHDLDKQMFKLKLDKSSFFCWAIMEQMCEWGLSRGAGRTEEEVALCICIFLSIFIFVFCLFFLVGFCICICRFPYKTVLSSGGGLGSEQEGEERRGGHLPCLP